jgi:hypothetical protein
MLMRELISSFNSQEGEADKLHSGLTVRSSTVQGTEYWRFDFAHFISTMSQNLRLKCNCAEPRIFSSRRSDSVLSWNLKIWLTCEVKGVVEWLTGMWQLFPQFEKPEHGACSSLKVVYSLLFASLTTFFSTSSSPGLSISVCHSINIHHPGSLEWN